PNKPHFLSRLTFWWFNALMLLGYKKPLTPQDLFPLNRDDTADSVTKNFNKNWAQECSDKQNPSIVNALGRTYGRYFAVGAAFHLIVILLQFTNPQFLK